MKYIDSSWNVMAHSDAREEKWRENWPMEWVACTLYTTSEHGVSSITTADAHTSAVSSRLNWRPLRFKWTRPFRRNTKFGFCACAITFQLALPLAQDRVGLGLLWKRCSLLSIQVAKQSVCPLQEETVSRLTGCRAGHIKFRPRIWNETWLFCFIYKRSLFELCF